MPLGARPAMTMVSAAIQPDNLSACRMDRCLSRSSTQSASTSPKAPPKAPCRAQRLSEAVGIELAEVLAAVQALGA